MRATMADIARETGLTLGTVSRALNTEGKYAIAPETRDRVSQTATRLGYRPNLLGRALAAGSASLVLLSSPLPFEPYYVEISRHLSTQAARHGFSFVSGGNLSEGGAKGFSASDWFYGVDGILLCDYLPHQEPYVVEALRLKIPVVGLGLRLPFSTDFVHIDLYPAVKSLVEHLVEEGRKDLAIMNAPGTPADDPRVRGYLEAAAACGLEAKILSCRDQSRASGREAVLDFYREGRSMDALFCENDMLAVGAYRGLTDLGIRVPDVVSLAGCDGLDESRYQHTPLTTLVQPLERACELAWAMLQGRIEGNDGPPSVQEVSARLQIRASTSPRR